jgi:hypothetical protein
MRVPYSKWMMMLETRINTHTDSFGFTNVMTLKAYLYSLENEMGLLIDEHEGVQALQESLEVVT